MSQSGTPPTPPPGDGAEPGGGRNERLGTILKRARERLELDLADVSEVTHVRRDYLRALEDGDYASLPEDVYARNFLRLFAQTVGLDAAPLLEQYRRERGLTTSTTPASAPERATSAPSAPARPTREPARAPRLPRAPVGPSVRRVASLALTLLVFALIVAGAVWLFNANLFTAGRSSASGDSDTNPVTSSVDVAEDAGEATAPATGLAAPLDDTADGATETGASGSSGSLADPAGDATEPLAAAAPEVLLTVTTDPPGARVMVDNFVLPGTTPIVSERVTARPQRVVTVTRDGYEEFEQTFDLSTDRELDIALTPVGAGAPTAADAAEGTTGELGAQQIEVEITGETWLEIYPSTARGQGQPLVYATVQPGARYVFTAPLFVRAGNAGGVRVRQGDGAAAPLGSTGEVVDRVFAP